MEATVGQTCVSRLNQLDSKDEILVDRCFIPLTLAFLHDPLFELVLSFLFWQKMLISFTLFWQQSFTYNEIKVAPLPIKVA